MMFDDCPQIILFLLEKSWYSVRVNLRCTSGMIHTVPPGSA